MTAHQHIAPEDERARMHRFVRRASLSGMALVVFMVATVVAIELARARFAHWTQHAHEVARVGRVALLRLSDQEAATGGVSVAHDGRPLDAVRAANELNADLDSLVFLTVDNPAQNALAQESRDAARRRSGLDAAHRPDAPPSLPATDPASIATRVALDHFLFVEDGLYRTRLAREERVHRLAPVGIILEVALLLFGFSLAGRRLLAQADLVVAHRKEVQHQNERLGQQNEELRQQSDQLEEQAIELEERQAELQNSLEEVRRERERFSSLLGSMTDSVYTIDRNQRMTEVYLSPAVRERWVLDSLIGVTPSERFGPDSAAAHDHANALVLAGTPVTFEWQHELNGERLFFSTALAPLRDAAGEISGAVGVTRDQTGVEHHKKQLAEAEQRLRHAQKLEAVGQLAGAVAHDYNNLLTVIISYAEMLYASAAAPGDDHVALGEILNAGHRAAALTRQLLTFSRREAVGVSVIDLCAEIRGVEQLLRKMISVDVDLTLQLPSAPCPVIANPDQVGQVLMNLVVNANSAMRAGGTLRISAGHAELDDAFAQRYVGIRSGPHVTLRVADTGEGMSEATRLRIFEPFFTTKPAGQGTGLGLATVYGIVKSWRGCIDVVSEPGGGTTFCIYVPSATGSSSELGGSTNASRHDTSSASSLAFAERPGVTAQWTILLVDDDLAVRGVAARMLRNAGHHVLEASDGTSALRVLDEQASPVHVLLTDMTMPIMGGRELAYEVRARYPQTSLVLMSGLSGDSSAVSTNDPLRNEAIFLDKPFTRESLLHAVGSAASNLASTSPSATVGLLPALLPEDRSTLDVLSSGIDAVVWEADAASGAVDYISRRAVSLLGYSLERLYEADFWTSILHEDDRERVMATRLDCARRLEGYSAEYRLLAANGATVWVRDAVCVRRNSVDDGVRFRGVMVDITEIKQTTEALRASHAAIYRDNQFLSAVLESLTDGVAACDETATLTLFNESMRRLVGRDESAIAAEKRAEYYGVHYPDGRGPMPYDELPLYRALQGEHVRNAELLVIPPDGSKRRVVANGRAFADADGNPFGAVVAVHDVTDIHQTLQELSAAKAEAEHAAAAKTQFLALMSHELHTPLNAVIGLAEVLKKNRDGNLSGRQVNYAERIAASGRRLHEIVSAALDLTAIQNGTLSVAREAVDLPSLLSETLDLLLPVAAQKGLRIQAHVPGTVKSILADAPRMRQVLASLVDNAIKFTDDGSIVVRVVVDSTAKPSRIEIEDSGPGIPAAHIESVFQPFFHSETLATRRHGGVGMGLVISRALCRAMGFDLKVESRPGSGTSCIIDLSSS